MMNYTKNINEIIVYGTQSFNIKQTLDCGQIFRYHIEDDNAVVYSKDKRAVVKTEQNKIIILTDDVDYFENFFDLKTDYEKIK